MLNFTLRPSSPGDGALSYGREDKLGGDWARATRRECELLVQQQSGVLLCVKSHYLNRETKTLPFSQFLAKFS